MNVIKKLIWNEFEGKYSCDVLRNLLLFGSFCVSSVLCVSEVMPHVEHAIIEE